jgi:primary-amine oxidase
LNAAIKLHSRTRHPLDPLTAEEIDGTAALLREDARFRSLPAGARFITIELRAPAKAEVLARTEGKSRPALPPLPREADVVLLDRADACAIETVVSLTNDRVTRWQPMEGAHPLAVVEELSEAEELVRRDPDFQAALAKRGVEDFETIQVDAWPAGYFGDPGERGVRLARCLAFVRPQPGDSEWAHPVDGLIALVDLTKLEVIRIDDHGAVPIPSEPGNFDVEAAIAEHGALRTDLKPFEITQPDGPSFEVDGNLVRWQNWELHVGFTPREGLVLNMVGYRDRGRLRPILYRASLSEMVVPYGDPSPTHYFKNAFDAGENGVGIAASSLTRGCDCLGEIRYFDATVSNGAGEPVRIPNAICLHEEDAGVLWRHIEWRTGEGEVRRARRLVISSFSAIGNYDYGFFWHLYQDGTIGYEIKLTGVLSTGAVAPGLTPRHGTLVAPGLNAMVHQHYFNVRLDLDIDGQGNTVEEVWTESLPPGPENPHGNAFEPLRRPLRSEAEAKRRLDPTSARWWEITNPGRRHRLGRPVAYRLVPGENTWPFAQPDAAVMKRAAFVGEHLWVTPYQEGERYAAGDYPNQHAGGAGLPEWTAADRDIADRDLVLWYTFGHHHVPRPEDWPVMSVASIGFSLKPVGFFERNPALDVPPPTPDEACHAPDGGRIPTSEGETSR